ncbi:hypothetical protein SAMN05446635_9196 [Burkholderia sp. OK233]|nr:hypothetical protein SAMN05446635_9196 [Burkholderia sp. OK233]
MLDKVVETSTPVCVYSVIYGIFFNSAFQLPDHAAPKVEAAGTQKRTE